MTEQEFLARPDIVKNMLVAERVMGKRLCDFEMIGMNHTQTMWRCKHWDIPPDYGQNCFDENIVNPYVSNIVSAWDVVEQLIAINKYPEQMYFSLTRTFRNGWAAGFRWNFGTWDEFSEAATPSLAICLFALNHVGAIKPA